MTKKHYPEVSLRQSFPEMEEKIINNWIEEKTFEKSISNNKDKEYVFYDGPPFANGLPHYGHLVTGYVKDIIPRYKTMQGYKVERKFGWDTHGLPAELQSEKELNVSGKLEILKYGIENFNKHCEKSVLKFTNIWEDYVIRQARWVDFKNSYKTLDIDYMESTIWAFKELYKKGYIYQDFKVVPYSWAIESTLSNFEIRMDNATRPKQDPAATVAFKITDSLNVFAEMQKNVKSSINKQKSLFITAWTTTPWTLPSNLALAVGSELNYEVFENNDGYYIFGKGSTKRYEKEIKKLNLVKVSLIKGKILANANYEPLFDYFKDNENSFKIIAVDWVEDQEGTGCVHMAPGFGEIDMETCKEHGISLVVPVDNKGLFTEEVYDFKGKHVFDCNKDIVSKLRDKNQIIRFETYVHNYPHCWRTDTPIIYKAINSWYVKVTAFKDRMVELNKQINWKPEHIKDGQFGKWIENTNDWNISRNRFWGAPIPIWMSTDPNYPRLDVYGSIEELEKDFGVKVKSLHRPYIDDLKRKNPDDPTGMSEMVRVEDVLDCWFESGSMPFAQMHYPFENKEKFEKNFPGDFIVEYVAQTRGWFYTLMIMSTAIFDKIPFKNCMCHGVVLDKDKQKLSKRLKNYPDPLEMFNKHGSDAMRWYMVSSSLLNGGDLAVDRDGDGIEKTVKQIIIPIWNTYYFFTLYANAENIKADFDISSKNTMDKYILIKIRQLCENVEESMNEYNIAKSAEYVEKFIDSLNNWYIRRSRVRFWDGDREAFNTLYTVLHIFSRVIAPLLPMISEEIYKSISGEESVHLSKWPDVNDLPTDNTFVENMDLTREICSAGLNIRENNNIRVRQPLESLTVVLNDLDFIKDFEYIIKEEVNVKEIIKEVNVKKHGSMNVAINARSVGKKLGKEMKTVMSLSKKGEWNFLDNGNIQVDKHIIDKDDFVLKLKIEKEKEGESQNICSGLGAVILNTNINEELKKEGIIRDIIRFIQVARKEHSLNISDRIQLGIVASKYIVNIIKENIDFVKKETLTTNLCFERRFSLLSKIEINNEKIEITLDKSS